MPTIGTAKTNACPRTCRLQCLLEVHSFCLKSRRIGLRNIGGNHLRVALTYAHRVLVNT
ncbi:Uncharacterised protein [Vibrio cholerae]|nr:Uncharacterised protein [Vibrio cholerae]CSB03457.1 Uncharacterised protein [Vibrio cholerae]CSC13717.1 Uncharacterised protein [Vibrio cholerae]